MRERTMLIVEDDDLLRRAMARELQRQDLCVEVAGSVSEARERLVRLHPDIVLLDVRLPDGNGLELARMATELRPKPKIIALSGQASPKEAFELAAAGVCAFLPKPISLDSLSTTLAEVLAKPLDIGPLLKDLVGSQTLHEARDSLRRTMVVQALALSGGNKTRAAELLRVTRQAVQQMIHEFELEG